MTIEQIVIVILAVVLAIAVVGLIVLLVTYQSLKIKVLNSLIYYLCL